VQIVQPATVVSWHRRLFAWQWRRRSAQPRLGRPPIAADIRALIQKMHRANPIWGAPRIHGELQKLGIEIAETTVAKYLGQRPPSPSPTWSTFLRTHLSQCASMDFFTVPTATFRVLFVLVILSHDRRRIVHLNVTDHPTAWTRQQIREAFPDQTAPVYLIRDRDGCYGPDFGRLLQSFDIEEILIAPCALGRIHSWSASLGPSGESVSITSSSGMNVPFDTRLNASWTTIKSGAFTSRWTRMRRSRERHTRQPAARLFKSPPSAPFITITNGAPPDHPLSPPSDRRVLTRRSARGASRLSAAVPTRASGLWRGASGRR
jgi:hypothetical protein